LARPPAHPPAARPQGVLAGLGTPRDPKTNIFATKCIAMPPFGPVRQPDGTEFWR